MESNAHTDNIGNIFWVGKHSDGTEVYHRVDGPAIQWCDGKNSFYFDGSLLSFDSWCFFADVYGEDKLMLKLKYKIS